MAKEGITGADNIINHYKAICDVVDGHVSAEVIATDFEGMVREGEALAALNSQIVVKLPMIADGIASGDFFDADVNAMSEALTDLLAGGIDDIVGRERPCLDVDLVIATRLMLLRRGVEVAATTPRS